MEQVLTRDARQRVHEAARELLAEAGMRVEHETARDELERAGATVDGKRVTLPPDLLAEAVEGAPESFRWRARDPEKSVTVGEGDPVVTPTRGPRYVKRPGEPRHRATLSDFDDLLQVCHEEPTIDVVGYDLCSPEGYSLPGNPGGYEEATVGYELLKRLFLGTDKPILASARSGDEARASLEMARAAFGADHLDDPVVLGILHARSPRVFNYPMVDGLLAFARAGQPLVVASGAIPGASAPVSLSEALVQLTAESLFGVSLVQFANPGSPVVFGGSTAAYDWHADALTSGTPRGSTLQTAAVEMADFYGLPARGRGGVTDSKAIGTQSGGESTFNLVRAVDSGADLLVCATGGLDGYGTISPEKTVLDAARIRALSQSRSDRRALADALESRPSLERIRAAEPGDSFFDERDPASISDATTFADDLAVRGSHESWIDAGEPDAVELAIERVQTLLDRYDRPPIEADREAALKERG